jgi:ribosomal protein L17
MKNKISSNEIVKIYKMHGIKITVKEAKHISSLMDSMIQAVKKRFIENSPQ